MSTTPPRARRLESAVGIFLLAALCLIGTGIFLRQLPAPNRYPSPGSWRSLLKNRPENLWASDYLTLYSTGSYAQKHGFFLPFEPPCGYNNGIVKQNAVARNRKKVTMKKFYYEFWLPFTITKKRILLLAIASYIALC
jgi:hypothetical protein